MARTRRRIGSSSGPVRTTIMGGGTTSGGSTSSSSGYRAPAPAKEPTELQLLSNELSMAQKRQQLAKLNDPFAKMINDLDAQVKFLQSQETFKKLAMGDPKGFLRDAEATLAGMASNDPQRRFWESAIKQATEKVEDQQWSSDLKMGLKTYEEWKTHLEGKLGSVRAGSPEASEIIQMIGAANKAASARDEAKLDQEALLAYTNSSSPERHTIYREYLQGKFLRVKDGGVQNEIIKQMSTLDDRKNKEGSISRAQTKSEILTGYLQGNGSAADTISRLQALARDPKITKEEVDAIQRSVESVIKKEEDKIEDAARAAKAGSKGSGGSGSTGVKAASDSINRQVDAAEQDYEKIKSKIDQMVTRGEIPSKELVDSLDAAGSVLGAIYEAAGKAHPNIESADKLIKAGINLPEKIDAIKVKVDTLVLKGADLSTAGKEAFGVSLAKAAEAKTGDAYGDGADLAMARLGLLVAAKDRLVTRGAQEAAETEITRVGALTRSQIQKLEAYTPPVDPAQKAILDNAYRVYKEAGEIKDNDKLNEKAFARAFAVATSPDDLAQRLGFKDNKAMEKQMVQKSNWKGDTWGVEEDVPVARFTQEGLDKIKGAIRSVEGERETENTVRATNLWTKLVRTPGVEVSPEEKYLYDMYGSGGYLDESVRAARRSAITNPVSSLETEDYMDMVAGRPLREGLIKKPPTEMTRSEDGMVTPEDMDTADPYAPPSTGIAPVTPMDVSEGARDQRLLPETPEEPTTQDMMPEPPGNSPVDENSDMRDPVQAAFQYLDTPESFDLQGLSIPDLPSDDAISPVEHGSLTELPTPWDSKRGEDADDVDAQKDREREEATAFNSRLADEPTDISSSTVDAPDINAGSKMF